MELFIGNLRSETRQADLQHFFGRLANNVKISLRKIKAGTSIDYYAHVNVESEKDALKIIKKFHGKRLNGKPVLIREYEYRAGNNDRRRLNWRNIIWNNPERRVNERRRHVKIFDRREPEFSGYNNLAKKG